MFHVVRAALRACLRACRVTFDRLREREWLGGKRRDGTDILNKTRVSRGYKSKAHVIVNVLTFVKRYVNLNVNISVNWGDPS